MSPSSPNAESPSARVRAADPRPARTRRAVTDAMLRLVAQGDTDITVFSLAKTAGVSRAAFYTHFSDLEDVALATLRPALDELDRQDAVEEEAGADPVEHARLSLVRLLDALVDSCGILRVIGGWKLTATADGVLTTAFSDRYAMLLRGVQEAQGTAAAAGPASDPASAEALQRHALFLAGGTHLMLTTWIAEDSGMSVSDVRSHGRELIDRVVAEVDVLSRAAIA